MWLRSHLVALLRDSTVACPAPFGASTLDILALFEETFHEPFSETPGAVVGARVRAIAKVLALIARDSSVGLELKTTMKSRLVHWSRRLKVPVASLEWRRRMETLEASHPKALHSRHCMAHADAQLALWIRSHEFLVPAEVVSGECSMALLILWEVDHGRSFPTQAGENPSHVVLGFTKRLKRQVSSDPELKEWLVWKDVFTSLSPGLPNLRHTRWAVRLKPPLGPSPPPWYEDFLARWRSFLEALVVRPAAQPPMGSQVSESTPSSLTDLTGLSVPAGLCSTSDRGAQCRQPPTPGTPRALAIESSAPPSASSRKRPRSPVALPSTTKRQRQLPPPSPSLPAAPASAVPPQEAPTAVPPPRALGVAPKRRQPSEAMPSSTPKRQRTLRGWAIPLTPTPGGTLGNNGQDLVGLGGPDESLEDRTRGTSPACASGHGRATDTSPT